MKIRSGVSDLQARAWAILSARGVLGFIFFPALESVRTAGPSLVWDEDPAAIVTGYALTVDGVRTDYGLTPQPAGPNPKVAPAL